MHTRFKNIYGKYVDFILMNTIFELLEISTHKHMI